MCAANMRTAMLGWTCHARHGALRRVAQVVRRQRPVRTSGGRALPGLPRVDCAEVPVAIQKGTRVLISLWDSLMFGRVPGTRPNISESHSEISTRVPFCIESAQPVRRRRGRRWRRRRRSRGSPIAAPRASLPSCGTTSSLAQTRVRACPLSTRILGSRRAAPFPFFPLFLTASRLV